MPSHPTLEQKYLLISSAALLLFVAVVWVAFFIGGQTFASAIVSGEGPLAYLHGNALRLLQPGSTEEQTAQLRSLVFVYLGRLTVVYFFCQALLLFGTLRYPRLLADFFSSESHALNLAIFRVAFFANVLPRVSLKKTLHLIGLPAESRVAPPGLSWWVENLPESQSLHVALYVAFVVACILSVVGLWTRYACFVATLLTAYLLGITQFFGKIEHQHYLVWIGALLSVSPCADVLSIDAWRKNGLASWLAWPKSVRYGLPLRCVWLFLGVLYFFPGLWKFVFSGANWFLSDNLRSRMLLRMFVSEGWDPVFPVYEFPMLCKLGGFITILLEIGFIFLVFLPWGRYLAASGALTFHWLVKQTLNISFWPIQICYLTFFDWHRAVCWVLKRPHPDGDPTAESSNSASSNTRLISAVAAVVLVGNTLCGFTLLDSWPFGVFPTFARVIGPQFQSLSFVAVDGRGVEVANVEAFFDTTLRNSYGVGIDRLAGILEFATRSSPRRTDRLKEIWARWHQQHPEITDAHQVEFYLVNYSTEPGAGKEPLNRTRLETIEIGKVKPDSR